MSTISPPARAVLMTGAELGIDFELKVIDLLNFKHREPEYIKVNENCIFYLNNSSFT